jgi:hypothetical protein
MAQWVDPGVGQAGLRWFRHRKRGLAPGNTVRGPIELMRKA